MKRIKTTRAWILFCYILAVTNASPGHRSHIPPDHGHQRSILSTIPPTIRIPDQLMSHSQEVSCLSADINIFDILNEAKQSCKGNDLRVKFYYYSNQKYYYIEALDINKELFDSILNKYDDWLITGERINQKDTVTNLPDHILEIVNGKVKNASEIEKGRDKVGGLVVSDDQDSCLGVGINQDSYSNARKHNNEFDPQDNENNKDAPVQENAENSIQSVETNDKYENYMKLKPKYDDKNKYFEVFLPKDDHKGKERTIHVEMENGRNDYPYNEEKQNKPDNILDTGANGSNDYNEKHGVEPTDLKQSMNEYERTNIQNESESNNRRVESSVNADLTSERNEERPQIYPTRFETTVNNGNDNNKHDVNDFQSNSNKSESIDFSNNVDMPITNMESSDDNLNESPDILNSYKSNNDRSMQNDKVNDLKLHLSLEPKQIYLNKDGVHKVDDSNLLEHEDESHISEILYHNPNENIFNHDDPFEDHITTKRVQINGENPYIYNPHDFEDSHEIALHDKQENHIRLNEPVYEIQGLSRDTEQLHAPYVFKLPKIYALYPQTLLENHHEPYLDSIGSNQPSRVNSADSSTSNLLIRPIGNLDLGELSRSLKPNSQTTASSVHDVSNCFKEDFTKQSPLDMDSNYQSLSSNTCQDSLRLLGSPLEKIKFLNTGLKNTPLNIGNSGFPSYSQLSKPSFKVVPNTKLFIDSNLLQSDALTNSGAEEIMINFPEPICNSMSETDLNANHEYQSLVGIKENPITNKHKQQPTLVPLETISELSRPQQFPIPEATHSPIFDTKNLGIDSFITRLPCSSTIGMGLPKLMDAIPKDLYMQNALDHIKQHPYVSNPRYIQPYVQNLLPISSSQVFPTPTSSLTPEFKETNPNLSFGAQNIKPIPQLPPNSFWNNPRQYICPSNPFSIPSKPLQNLQSYREQQLPIGIPQYKNPHIPSPLLLNNNFEDPDSSVSFVQQDFHEPSLINIGSVFNKPLSYKPCFANLPPQVLTSERPSLLSESGGFPCFNLPLNKENLIVPNQKITLLSKIPAELTAQNAQVNAQILSTAKSNDRDIIYLNDSPSTSTENNKLSIQNTDIKENIFVNPVTSDSPQKYLDSSLLRPSILSPCPNNAIKTIPSIQYGSERQTGEIAENSGKQSLPVSLNPMIFSSTKIPNFVQSPWQNYPDSFLSPPNIVSSCLNPEFETQKAIQGTPQYGQFEMDDSVSKQLSPLNLKPMLFSSPRIPNYKLAPSQNFLDSSLLPPSIFSPYLKNAIENQPNIKGIPQNSGDSHFEMADSISNETPPGFAVHVPPAISNYIKPTQNHLDSSLLPPSILSPCFQSGFDTSSTLPNIQSIYQSGDNFNLKLPPFSRHPILFSLSKKGNYIAPSQDYLDSSLLPPSILSPCLNTEIQMIPPIEGSNYFSSESIGVVNKINQRPSLESLKQPAHFFPHEISNYNQINPQLKQHQIAYEGSLNNEEICKTPLNTMILNNYPTLTSQNAEIIRGPSPCAQQISHLENCHELPVNPEIPSLYNIPSLMSAFPNVFAPKNLQPYTLVSVSNSVSSDVIIDSSPPGLSSGFKSANPDYSQFENQIIPSSSPTICPGFSSNIESSLPHSTITLPSYPNGQLPSTLIGPSLKPLLWPNVQGKYPIGNFLSPKLLQTGPLPSQPQANPWKEGTSTNIFQDNPELSRLSIPNDFSTNPNDFFSPHIPDSMVNLYDIPLSPKLLFLNRPLIPQQTINPYTFSPLPPCHSSTPYIPQTSPTLQSTSSSFISSPTSTIMPLPCDSQLQHSLKQLSNNLPKSPPFATNQLTSIPTSNYNEPCFTLDTDPPILPQNINVEAITSQPSIKSTAYNPQVNNKEYISIPQHNIDISSQSSCEDSLPSHLIHPSLDSILQAVPSTEKSVTSNAPKSDLSLSVDSVSETNTYPYTFKTNEQQSDVPKLESSEKHQISLAESVAVNSDSKHLEMSVTGNNPPTTESEFSTDVRPYSEQHNLQNIGKSMVYDKISTDFKITDEIITNIPSNVKFVDNINGIVLDNFTPHESEFINNNEILTEAYKVKPLQTTQLYENTNQYELKVANDVLSLQYSAPKDDKINILPSSLLPGSSILSNAQEVPTLNMDITKVETTHMKPSSDKNSPQYTTPDTSLVIPIKSHTLLSSHLQPPSLSDLQDLTSKSNEFISKEFIPQDNQLTFLDTALQGSSLPTILSSPSTQSSKYTISSLDRNAPFESRPKSFTWPQEYLKDSRSFQMLEESQPTYQYIPPCVNNILPQSDFSESTFINQPPCNYHVPSTFSYLPLDKHLIHSTGSQLDSTLSPTVLNNLRPVVDNVPRNLPIHVSQRPEGIETYIPYTLLPENIFPSNNDLSKIKFSPRNIANIPIPQNIVTLPHSDSNAIMNGLTQYRPLYSQPCGLDILQPTVPMTLPPSLYNPQAVSANLQSNPPIYNPYSPIFNSENPISESPPCPQKLQPILAAEIQSSTVPTHIYQPVIYSPCDIGNSPLSTSNIYLTSPTEISPSESLYSSEYMLPIVPPMKSVPKFESPSYSVPPFSTDTTLSPTLKIPNNQNKISDDLIKDSRLTLPDLQSLGISNIPCEPIHFPLNTERFIPSPISVVPQYNIESLIPQVFRTPVINEKIISLPCSTPQPITHVSPPQNVKPTLLSLPPSIRPIAASLPTNMIPIKQSPPQYTLPLSRLYYSLPIQSSFTKPPLTVSKPISQAYSKPSGLLTGPQFSVDSRPISPITSPIFSPSSVPFAFTQSSTNPQFSVISRPISPNYATLLPATTPTLTPSTTPFSPTSTSAFLPCSSHSIIPTYEGPLSYFKPTPNYIRPLSEFSSYLPSRGSNYQLPSVMTSLSPYVQQPTSIKKPLSNTYANPISLIHSPQSNIVQPKYSSSLPSEYINSVFTENKAIQANPFTQPKKNRPLPSNLPNKLNSQSNISLRPYIQPMTFTPQAANIIAQKAVIYPTNIQKPEFLKYLPQSMTFSSFLNTEKPTNLVINEPLSSSDNICQENFEAGKDLIIPSEENPIEILGDKESIVNENTQPNTVLIPTNAVPNFNQQLFTPYSLKQSPPFNPKQPYTTSGVSLPYLYPNIPRLPAYTKQSTLSSTSSVPTPCIFPPISSAPEVTSEILTNVLEYPYNMAPVDIRQKSPSEDNQPNYFLIPSYMIPNYQQTTCVQNPSSSPNLSQIPLYNTLKLTPASLPSNILPPSLSKFSNNLTNFTSQAPQLNPFNSALKLLSFPSYTLPPSLPISPKLSSTASSYIPTSVTYTKPAPRPLQSSIARPLTPTYDKYSTPMTEPYSANISPLYYTSQKQLPVAPQYLKPSSVPLQVPKFPITTNTHTLRPWYSQFAMPSGITSPILNIDDNNPDLTYYLTPQYLTPQSYLNNVALTKIQGIPISSQLQPCPLSPQDTIKEIKSSSIEPLVSESLISQEYLDTLQTPPPNILSALPIYLDKDIQLTPVTRPCSSRYRQVDIPKELNDLLQKMPRPRPKVSNYQYPITYPYSDNLVSQTSPQPILDTTLPNSNILETQPLTSSSSISINEPSSQLLSELNNIQNIITNAIHRPILPPYTITNIPIHETLSSIHKPKIPCSVSSVPKPNHMFSSVSSNKVFVNPDLEYTDTSQVNASPDAIPANPCIFPSNKPLIYSVPSLELRPLLYSHQPTTIAPTDPVSCHRSQSLQYASRPTFKAPSLLSLPCQPYAGNNNQINPFKQLPASLQGPSVLGTEFEDISEISTSNDVGFNSSPLSTQTHIEYANAQPITAPTLPISSAFSERQSIYNEPYNNFLENKQFVPASALGTNYPSYSYASMPSAESLTLSEDVVSSPSNVQPCSEVRPNYQQFSAPPFVPHFVSPYLYTPNQSSAKNLLPTPNTSQSKFPQPSYPCTSPDIWTNASPSQSSHLSYSQPLLSDVQKLLRLIANPSSSFKYKNPASHSSDKPVTILDSNYISPSSDFEIPHPSSEVTPQYTQVNLIQPLLAALNKGPTIHSTKYPHYLPCDGSKSKENDYVQTVQSLPVSVDFALSANNDNLPVDIDVDILPNSLQNPSQYDLPSVLTPYTSPSQQYVPPNTLSSSDIQAPSKIRYDQPSLLSGRPQLPLFNSYSENLHPKSLPCQSSLPPKTQNWSSIPNMAIFPPRTIQPNWWNQNGPNRIPFIRPTVDIPCPFIPFTPYDNNIIKPSSQITIPQYEPTISENTNIDPNENTVYVNANKYTETRSHDRADDSFKEIEIDNSITKDNFEIHSDTIKSIDNTEDFNEGYNADVDFISYENLNNIQGPNPESKYTLRQPLIIAPFGKSVPDDYISALKIPNIRKTEDSFKDSEIERVKLPTYVYNRNIDNIIRNAPKYLPINIEIPTIDNTPNQYNDLSNISPNEYKTIYNKIQKSTTFNVYPNLYNTPYRVNNCDNNLINNNPEEPLNAYFKTTPIDLYRDTESTVTNPLGVCTDSTEIPSNKFQYYPQLKPDYAKYTYPQILKPFIASNLQVSSLEPDKFFGDSKATPYFTTKPCQLDSIKYSGYKTYQIPNLYQEPSISHEPRNAQPICNIADNNIPIQNLPTPTGQQSSNPNGGDPNNMPLCIDNEIKSSVINYLKRYDQKENFDTNELTIPIRKFAIVKPLPYSEHTIKTNYPSLGLKVWKSNIKVVEAEIRLKFKDLSVINFMPVVNNSNDFDIEEIKNIVKTYINEKYGDHFDVSEPYVHNNEYQVIKEIDKDFKYGKYNLLWPTKCVNA